MSVLFCWGEAKLPIKNATMGFDYAEVLQEHGFRNGDLVVAVDGENVVEMADLVEHLLIDKAKSVTVTRNNSDTTFFLPADFRKNVLAVVNDPEDELFVIRFPFVIKDFVPGSVAEKAGMQVGDSIVSLNDTITVTALEFMDKLAGCADMTINVGFYRGGELMSVPVQLDATAKIGAYLKQPTEIFETHVVEYGFFESIPIGINNGLETLGSYVKSLKLLFTKEGISQLGGFGSIGSLFPSVWNWEIFWTLTAFLSIILAFMNIIPIPGLDGGHMMFTLYEMVTRRKPSDKFLEYAQTVGMLILFALLIFANGNDLIRWLNGKF